MDTRPIIKTCTKCKVDKPADQMGRDRRRRDGLSSWCMECAQTATKLAKRNRDKAYTNVLANEYYHKNKHTDRMKRTRSSAKLKQRYGLTLLEVEAMVEEQDGMCAICGRDDKPLVVDHCHDTGAVRGMLCQGCNVRLSGFDDESWMQKALAYLGRV